MTIQRFRKPFSALRRILRPVKYVGLYCLERFGLGTKLHEWIWRSARGGWFERWNQNSVYHSHRRYLVEAVARFAPVESLLEVGCGCGPNLMLMGKTFTDVQLRGIDVCLGAIQTAQKLLLQAGITGCILTQGYADNLASFPDESVDVVLTDATLMYIGPDKISRVLSELWRVARKGILLSEWNFTSAANASSSRWLYMHWIHDYYRLVSGLPRATPAPPERFPDDAWADPTWAKYGVIIRVEKDLLETHSHSGGRGRLTGEISSPERTE